MRFGLVGTGPWAHLTQGPGLQAAEDVELVGVWGRNEDKANVLATDLKTTAYTDYAALLADVDALTFAVPPNVQASMALEAAAVGKHLLLDKPVANSLDDARALADEVANEGIASVVFFTGRFQPETRAFFDQTRKAGGWKGGWSRMLSDLRAVGGEAGLVHLVLTHESGATSTASMTLSAPPEGVSFETAVWGETGTAILPAPETTAVDAFALAATELVAAAESGDSHPVDVAFGTRVVELLASAEAQLAAGR